MDAADALATAVFVMGVEGLDMIEMIDGAEALVITNEREIIRTSGFGGYEIVRIWKYDVRRHDVRHCKLSQI